MRRGELYTAAIQGDYGKPRPVVIIQSDLLGALDSVVICPVTSVVKEADFRVVITPDPTNGLQKPSQIMVDKVLTLPRSKIGQRLGRLNAPAIQALNRALLVVVGLA